MKSCELNYTEAQRNLMTGTSQSLFNIMTYLKTHLSNELPLCQKGN